MAYDDCMIVKLLDKSDDASQLGWFGHVERISYKCLVKIVYDGEVDGVRLIGRPRLEWIESSFKNEKN